MFRIKILAVMLLAAFVVAVAGSQAASQTSQAKVRGTLIGTVGPGFAITLKQKGKTVKTLKAGVYRFKVSDNSDVHNFHLFGPGVNKKTGVGSSSGSIWTVKLKKGKYTYRCDIHFASGMIGHFKVVA